MIRWKRDGCQCHVVVRTMRVVLLPWAPSFSFIKDKKRKKNGKRALSVAPYSNGYSPLVLASRPPTQTAVAAAWEHMDLARFLAFFAVRSHII